MKKLILSIVAATMVASPILAAPAEAQQRRETTIVRQQPGRTVIVHRDVRQEPRATYRDNRRQQQRVRNWHRGERFDRREARNYQVISSYRNYRLNAPPRGYQWVRSGNDAVMVAITSGIIAAVMANAIR